jgi:hypothetical protein
VTTHHTVCPGPCNRIWRQSSPEDETQPRYGDPIWCRRDTNIVTYSLGEIPELLAAIEDDAANGTPTRGVVRRGGSTFPAWPGQASMLAIDAIADGLTELEDRLRTLRNYSPRSSHHGAAAARGAIGLLTANLDWLLTAHPDAADPDISPGAVILRLHWNAQRTAKADPQRAQLTDLPCPSCKYQALALAPGDDSYECAFCGRRLRLSEYQEYVKDEAAKLR